MWESRESIQVEGENEADFLCWAGYNRRCEAVWIHSPPTLSPPSPSQRHTVTSLPPLKISL